MTNLRTDEIAANPWEFAHPEEVLQRFARKRLLSPGFLRRIRRKPVTIAYRTYRKNSGLRLRIGSAGGGITINGITLPLARAADFLVDQFEWNSSYQAAAMSRLAWYAAYNMTERDMLSTFPREIPVFVAGQMVQLRIKPVKREKRWFVVCEGESYPTTLSQMMKALPSLGEDRFHRIEDRSHASSSTLRTLTGLGVPPGKWAELLLRKAAGLRDADRKARGLLSQIMDDNKERVRILRERKGLLSVLVKGKIRDYRVTLRRNSITVRRHPSGGYVCIDDRQAASCPMDKLVSRVMALLNDERLQGRIHTLRGGGNEPEFADLDALDTVNGSAVTLVTDLAETGREMERRRLTRILRQLDAYRNTLLETRFRNQLYPSGAPEAE